LEASIVTFSFTVRELTEIASSGVNQEITCGRAK